jgi:hypothetical protein
VTRVTYWVTPKLAVLTVLVRRERWKIEKETHAIYVAGHFSRRWNKDRHRSSVHQSSHLFPSFSIHDVDYERSMFKYQGSGIYDNPNTNYFNFRLLGKIQLISHCKSCVSSRKSRNCLNTFVHAYSTIRWLHRTSIQDLQQRKHPPTIRLWWFDYSGLQRIYVWKGV